MSGNSSLPRLLTVRKPGGSSSFAIMRGDSTPHASAIGEANQAGSFSFSPMKPALSDHAAYPDGITVTRAIAQDFDVKPFLLKSWLRHLTYIRNLCGHHSRIYNRTMTTRATLLRADARFDGPKAFPTIIILKRLYERLWSDEWNQMNVQLTRLVDEHLSVPLEPMGFPDDWRAVIR